MIIRRVFILSAFLFLLLPSYSRASGLVHTIQLGSYFNAADAEKHFDAIAKKLNENKLQHLRIEKVGQIYTVRLGKFDTYTSAARFDRDLENLIPGSALVKAYIKEERIIRAYSEPAPLSETWEEENNTLSSEPEINKQYIVKTAYKSDGRLLIPEDNNSGNSGIDDNDSWSQDTAQALLEEGIAAITTPSADMTLSFTQPGRISKVRVKEGDMVKANQVLLEQDYAAEQIQLSLLRKQSEDMTQIESQRASLTQKRVFLERLRWAAERGSATKLELEEAKLAVTIAEYSLKSAEFEHEQNKRKYEEAKIRVDQMSLKSPVAGRVEKVEVEEGEAIDGLASAVRVVKIDPLWIDVHVPLGQEGFLQLGQYANVVFQGDRQNAAAGLVTFISTVADAASSTLRARIEVPNKFKRRAGEHVTVLFAKP